VLLLTVELDELSEELDDVSGNPVDSLELLEEDCELVLLLTVELLDELEDELLELDELELD